jgi:aspartyl-tRNA(Asn)/glutamyl-tRNA(Gln) amidotransferase subunit A
VNDEDLAFSTVRQLGELLRAREVSPSELTRLFLARLDRLGTSLRAVVTITEEVALAEASLAEAELLRGVDRGPLHGIPYGLKDIVATAGIRTTWGGPPFRDQVFDYDGAVTSRLRNAGAILVAKLATIELAGGMGYDEPAASLTGATANPWNTEAWVGGSSSGPSAAMAAGLVPFTIGSDTGGSITLPAAWTGTAGLRATYGRVSRYGAMALCWTFDRLGPICRTADDCGLVLESIAGYDPRDPSSLKESYAYQRSRPRRDHFRIGAIKGACVGIEDEVRTNFNSTVKVLETLGTVEEVELPAFPYGEVAHVIMTAEITSAFDELVASGGIRELAGAKAHAHRLAGLVLPAHDYLRAQRIRRQLTAAFDDLASGFDALVAPTLGVVASGLHDSFAYMRPEASPQPINLAGVISGAPTVSVFNGLGQRGLPTGVGFTGGRYKENAILDAAHAFEEATRWWEQRPPLFGIP